MCLSVCLLVSTACIYSVCMSRSDVDAPSLPRARYLSCPTGDINIDGVENCCAVKSLPTPVMSACLFPSSPDAMLISTFLYFRLLPPPPSHKNLLLLFPAKVSTFPPSSEGKALKFCHVRMFISSRTPSYVESSRLFPRRCSLRSRVVFPSKT
jgi:hypothetical protein